MGVLIVLGLAVVVWKVIDLAKQKAAREEMEAAKKELVITPAPVEQMPETSFAFDLTLESGERILETSAAAGGLWIRIGQDGKSSRLILVDYSGKIIGTIQVKRDHEETLSAE